MNPPHFLKARKKTKKKNSAKFIRQKKKLKPRVDIQPTNKYRTGCQFKKQSYSKLSLGKYSVPLPTKQLFQLILLKELLPEKNSERQFVSKSIK